MSKTLVRFLVVLATFSLIAAACGDDDDDGVGPGDGTAADTAGDDSTDDTADDTADGDGTADDADDGGPGDGIDYEALGLWDDGPCDESRDPLVIGLMTVFESPVLTLIDQARALEASVVAFNARGGANGACIEVHTCDDGVNFDQALECARDLDRVGVHATVNDQGTVAHVEVAQYMAEAGIPRVAANVVNETWDDTNSYPLDASGSGVTFMMPKALIDQGVTEIGVIRVDTPSAGVLVSLFAQLFGVDGATFPVDLPVPAGTTDYSQFILAAENAGAGGIILAAGEQEAVQVVRAGQQLGTELLVGASLGTFAHSNVADFGDFADQMIFTWPFPPATFDLPVYEALRADLAASGESELQPENLKTSPMRSWIGLYALLRMIRDDGMTEFSREAITAMVEEAENVPMLDMFGGEDWTPTFDRGGMWMRPGVNRWAFWRWDPAAEWDGNPGNFVHTGEVSFDDVLCGSPFGDPGPC